MLLTQVLVAAGVAYAGAKTLAAYRPWHLLRQPFGQRQRAVLATVEPALATDQTVETVEGELESAVNAAVTVQEAERYRLAAAGAVVLTIGGLAFPVLTVASVPFTLYSSIPIFENASRALIYQRRLQPATFTSLLLVVWLVTNRYMPAAALAWLHHSLWLWKRNIKTVAEKHRSDLLARVRELLQQATGAPPQTVWLVEGDVEVETAYAVIKVGDVLAVSAGEFVPVAGEIVAGDARLYGSLSDVVGTSATVSIGDRLEAGALVIEGKVRVRVSRLPTAHMS